MNRRSFFGTMIGGLAATAAVRTWPFRVYSFPSQPILAPGDLIIPYSEFFAQGQTIAAYSGDGELQRGYYRVKRVDAAERQIHIEYITRPEFLGLERS